MDPVNLKRNAKMTNKGPASKAKDPASEAKDPASKAKDQASKAKVPASKAKVPASKAKEPASEAKYPAENASYNRGSECASKKSDEIASHSDSRNATPDRGIPDSVKETKLNSIKSDLKKISALLTTLNKSPAAGTGSHPRGGSNQGSRPTTPVTSTPTLKRRRIEEDDVQAVQVTHVMTKQKVCIKCANP